MKLKSLSTVIIGFVSTLTGCKKNHEILLTTNLTIVNADVNMAGIKVDPGRNVVFASETPVAYGGYRVYALDRKTISFNIVNAADTTSRLYTNVINFQSGICSLFLTGQAPNVEAIIKEETDYPFIRMDKILTAADSVVNLRFVNLSPNSVPVKIKIAGAPTNQVDNLPYKSFSSWKTFNALLSTTNYSLEIKDAATDALISTYTFSATLTNRFKNVTLVIKGLQGTTSGTNAFGVMVVNYF